MKVTDARWVRTMTADHPDEPTVPVSDLRELIDTWRHRGVNGPYGATWSPPATELEELVAEYE